MAQDPRAALERLFAAFDNFHQVATTAGDPESLSVLEAADALAEAYTLYDDVMFRQFDVDLPLDVYSLDDDEYDEDFDDDYEDIDEDDESDSDDFFDDDYDDIDEDDEDDEN